MVFVSVNMMSWNDYGLWSQKDPGASPAGSRHHFCPLKTLGIVLARIWSNWCSHCWWEYHFRKQFGNSLKVNNTYRRFQSLHS